MNPLRDKFRWLRLRIPLRPAHTDKLAQVRRKRNAHIAKAAAKQESFKRYWRRNGHRDVLRNIPRADRRRAVLRWYRAQKHEVAHGCPSTAQVPDGGR